MGKARFGNPGNNVSFAWNHLPTINDKEASKFFKTAYLCRKTNREI